MPITLLHLMLMSKIYIVNSDRKNVIGMSDPNVIFKGPRQFKIGYLAFVYLLLLRVGENSLQQAWAILVSDPSLHYLMKHVRKDISIIATLQSYNDACIYFDFYCTYMLS